MYVVWANGRNNILILVDDISSCNILSILRAPYAQNASLSATWLWLRDWASWFSVAWNAWTWSKRDFFFFTQSYNSNVCIVNAPFDVTHQGNIGARQHTLVDHVNKYLGGTFWSMPGLDLAPPRTAVPERCGPQGQRHDAENVAQL